MINDAKSYVIYNQNNKTFFELYHEKDVKDMENNHHHPQDEICIILSGTCDIKYNGKITNVKEGDIFLFRSNEPHQLINITEKASVEILSVSFMFNLFSNENSIWLDSEVAELFSENNPDFISRISNKSRFSKKIKKAMLSMKQEFEDVSETNNEYIIKGKFLELIGILIQYYNRKSKEGKTKSQKHIKEIEDTMVYINQHYNDNITLEQLAQIANMNKFHYCTVFKNINHQTVWDYISERRINTSLNYLNSTQKKMTILEIATLCGFNNTVNFNKCFKKIMGMTPSEYRKQIER